MIIAPSIASADQSRLGWAVEQASIGGADLLHFDIEDGVFIPNLTFGPRTIKHLRPLSKLPFDVHIQVAQPTAYLEQVVDAGADIVTVQVESTRFPFQVLHTLRQLGVRVGMAFNAATSLGLLSSLLDDLDVVHLMTADPDGGFIPGTLAKIREAKQMIGDRPIDLEVDGGIMVENAVQVAGEGATIIVAGRAIWGQGEPGKNILELRAAASRAHQR